MAYTLLHVYSDLNWYLRSLLYSAQPDLGCTGGDLVRNRGVKGRRV